MRWY
ncbi:hypothetical protein E2C01_077855 [Portunus trituberculatus]